MLTLKPLTLAAVLALALPAMAQQTDEDAPANAAPAEGSQTETAPAGNDPGPGTTLDMGTEVTDETDATGTTAGTDTAEGAAPAEGTAPADGANVPDGTPQEPQVGQQYVRDTSGDWSTRCLRTETGNDPCQLYQLLEDADGNSVAEISIVRLPDDSRAAAGATIVTPLETLLSEDLRIEVDGGQTRTYEFSFCNRAGCISRVGFTPEEIAQFKRGSRAVVTIVPAGAPDQTVPLDVSLSGFTAGFDALPVGLPAQ